MRTTITLEPDVAALVEKSMRERGISFKEAVNAAIRTALGRAGQTVKFETPTFDMGGARVDLTSALTVAGALEDEDLRRKIELAK